MSSDTPPPEDVLILEHTRPRSGELYDLTADRPYDKPIAEVCGEGSDEDLPNQAKKAAQAAGWVITKVDGEFRPRYGPPYWLFQGYRSANTETNPKETAR